MAAESRWATWERYAPLAGILFVLALLASIVILATANVSPSDPPLRIALRIAIRPRRYGAAAYLDIAAAVFFLIYLVGLWRALRRGASDFFDALTLVMGVAGILFYTAGRGVIDGALGDQGGKMSLDTVYALHVLNQAFASVGYLFLGLFGLGAGLLSLDARVLPSWLGWVAIASGVLLVIGVFGLSTLGGGAPGLLGVIGLFLLMLFVLVSSIILLMRNRVVPAGAGLADA